MDESLADAIRAWLPKAIEASESDELLANSGKVSMTTYPTYSRSVSEGWILDGAFEASHYPEWNLCALASGEPRAEVMLISDRLLAIPHFSVALLPEIGGESVESRTPDRIAGTVIGGILAPFLMEFRYRRRAGLNDDDVIQSLLKELGERYMNPDL